PAMIAARVANGPRVARAAGGRASGRRQAAAAVRMTAAAHSTTGSQSRGDAIVADTSGFSDVIVGMPPRILLKFLVTNDRGSQDAWLGCYTMMSHSEPGGERGRDDELMAIPRLAERIGVTPRVLRYWEEQQLISPTREHGKLR